MAVLIDEDFQSYAVAAAPPYGPYASGGSLVLTGVAIPRITATPVGVFGDTKSLDTPPFTCLQFPSNPTTNLQAYYQQFTVYQAFQIASSNGLSENGLVMAFCNYDQPVGASAAIATLKILGDGTLGFCNEGQTAFFAVSDFSLLVGQWYFFRVDISFSILGSGHFAYTCTWYVDGIARLTATVDTGVASGGGFAGHAYCNALIFGGVGGGVYMGRLTVYDAIQAAGFYPHPGTPVARVTQGVIELITSTVPGPAPPDPPPGPPPGPPVPGPGGCAEQSKLSVAPGLSVAGTAPPSIPGQTNSLKSQL